MIDVGFFSYKKAISTTGPIAKVSYTKIDNLFQASAYLKDELTHGLRSNYSLYDPVDGNGFSSSPYLAVRKAISEAIERWAFYNCVFTNSSVIQIDKTTSGFAAYPELFSFHVKYQSHIEAVERWALHSWNKNKTSNSEIKSEGLINYCSLITSFKNTHTVIVWQNSDYGYCYGFSSDSTFNKSFEKAKIEMKRNLRVLTKRRQNTTTVGYEKRLLYFASEDGYKYFIDKVESQKNTPVINHNVLINSAVDGPWTKYARVWRTLYGPDNIYTDDLKIVDYFLF